MIAMLFQNYGWKTTYLGADLPLDYAVDYVERQQPDLVGLSGGMVYQLPIYKETIHTFSHMNTPPHILVGGRLASFYTVKPEEAERITVLKEIKDSIRGSQT